DYLRNATDAFDSISNSKYQALTNAASLAAIYSKAKLIIVFDEEGELSLRLSKSRPVSNIICVTSDIKVARRLTILWGVYSYLIDNKNSVDTDNKFKFVNVISNLYGLKNGDKVLLLRTKVKHDYDIKEETLRIITIDQNIPIY
ncbi:MAG: hypothetical protein LBV58_03155, partial [Acholeplasmatales bacterium]|nr:hypothetical protein [Acholeplasmatales bacterium]